MGTCDDSVLQKKRWITYWNRIPHRHHHLSSLLFWPLFNLQCAMMQRRPGGVTSTSLCLTPMDPVQFTPFKCFHRFSRYLIPFTWAAGIQYIILVIAVIQRIKYNSNQLLF